MKKDLEMVFCYLESTEKFSAIDEVINKCKVFDELKDKDKFVKAVHKREKIQSTGIGHGVAIAHGKLDDIDHCHIALGYSKDGIIFDEHYSEPVRLVFVVASNKRRQAEYIHSVSNILSWVHDEDFRRQLKDGIDSHQVKEFLRHLEKQEFIPRYN